MSKPLGIDVSPEEIIIQAADDNKLFISLMMPDLEYPIPDFHDDMFERMKYIVKLSIAVNRGHVKYDTTQTTRMCLAIPRAHSKTTLAKLFCAWVYIYTSYSFIVYVNKTTDAAIKSVNDIVNYLLSDNAKKIFGAVDFVVNKWGEGEHHFWYRGKLRIIKALGTGKQIRGMNIDNQRPQLAICDDVEDTENVSSEHMIKNTFSWFYGQFIKALARHNSPVIQLGNLISGEGLLATHLTSDQWMGTRYGCLLANGQPLWPDMWPFSAIQADFNSYMDMGLLGLWFAEMMNQPTGGQIHLIDPDKIVYKPSILEPEEIYYGFITVDPAISKQETADSCAIVAHGWDGNHWRQLEVWVEKNVTPFEIFNALLRIAFSWRISVIGVEANAFQQVLIYLFTYWCRKFRYDNFVWKPLFNKNKKLERLKAWAGMLHAGDIAFNSDDLEVLDAALDFKLDKTNNDDDLIDCCSFLVQMTENYMGEIIEASQPDVIEEMSKVASRVVDLSPV